MARKFTPKIVTANDLFSGDVIYLTAADSWSHWHQDAQLLVTPEQADARLDVALAQQEHGGGPYLADAAIGDNCTLAPTHFREAIRTRGPSNYFHGKQAEQGDHVSV